MTHAEAVEAAIASVALGRQNLALVELCRTLAGQMDGSGADPSTRLSAAYLSALKDLRRAIAEAPDVEVRENKLTRLRRDAGWPEGPAPTLRRGLDAS